MRGLLKEGLDRLRLLGPARRVRQALQIAAFRGRNGEVHGCDYNRRLVEWCQRHLRFGRFEVNDLRPPLPYPDGRFDLVYALSVFTHLPEELQRPWIEELLRILEPGGHLILSLHGQRYRDELRPEERRGHRAAEEAPQSSLTSSGSSLTSGRPVRGKCAARASPAFTTPLTMPSVKRPCRKSSSIAEATSFQKPSPHFSWIPLSPTTAKRWLAGATKMSTPFLSAVAAMPSFSKRAAAARWGSSTGLRATWTRISPRE